jgi:hypothetical protein
MQTETLMVGLTFYYPCAAYGFLPPSTEEDNEGDLFLLPAPSTEEDNEGDLFLLPL